MALEDWNIDVVHSTVGFTVRHLMVSKVHGYFTKWNGTLAFDEQNPSASHAEAQIEIASVASDRFKVTGDLTLRGVTRSVALDVEYGGRSKHPQMGERVGFSANTSINRKDFGVSYNQVLEAGGIAISEKVDIHIEIEA